MTVLGLFIIVVSALTNYKVNKENRINFLNEIKHIANERITNVKIVFDESTVISLDPTELSNFSKEIKKANTSTPSGHSGPIAEGCLQIVLASGNTLYYYAAVHEYDQENLYLKRDNYMKVKEGIFEGTAPSGVICIPFLGNWYKQKLKNAPFLRAHPSDSNKKVIFF